MCIIVLDAPPVSLQEKGHAGTVGPRALSQGKENLSIMLRYGSSVAQDTSDDSQVTMELTNYFFSSSSIKLCLL